MNQVNLSTIFRRPVLALIGLIACLAWPVAAAPDPTAVEFFEKKIRPLLVDHCYNCHSAQSEKGVKGDLWLDTQAGVLKGGENGPALVPGDPEKSLLIKAVRYKDENLQMPPKGKKLSDAQIADLEMWVKMGAPDPRTNNASASQVVAKNHWAFKQVVEPAVPAVKMKRWPSTPVDNFILSRLEARSIKPSSQADKRTLIRRATYDLTGLPPTPEEVDAFENDKSPGAYAALIERLLASPRYGERWGRYWLDVARYADTKGYVFEEERRYPYAYTYRDYVIRSFNDDLPFDRFIIEQIAADQLDLGGDKRALAALGYLTLGRRFLNNQNDIIDDRIDVVSRGMMGLTVTCARCHDHKFDPIPTKDYYSLHGVFASSHEPGEKPLLGTNSLPKEYPQYLEERGKRQKELEVFKGEKQKEIFDKLRQHVGDYLLAAHDASKLPEKGKQEGLARERKLDPTVVQRWKEKLKEWQAASNGIFAVWSALADISTNRFTDEAKSLTEDLRSNPHVHPLVKQVVLAGTPASLNSVAENYNKLFADIDRKWKAAGGSGLTNADEESLRQVLYADGMPASLSAGELTRLYDVPTAQKVRALQRKLDELDATHAGAPPRAMALFDNDTPQAAHVFKRGNPANPGPEVPRQFLELISGPGRKPFQKGSGRLELAKSIASPNNPLTARVLVNRVWLHHFGQPLVSTPSDFGVRADPPTHPELLDYLAARFVAGGWSVKALHRWIMLSSTYQQRSDDNPKYAAIDPSNQLLWKMNRRRLDFEAMRDTMLAMAGKLDLSSTGGHAVDIVGTNYSTRRTIYGFIDRQNLPGLFRTFDFASPDTTSPQRFNTTVPQQALFLLNSPFAVDQTRNLLTRTTAPDHHGDTEKIRALYELLFQRAPDREEVRLGEAFLQQTQKRPTAVPETPAWQYGYGSLDSSSGGVRTFTALPYFTGSSWQGGQDLPDKKTGWVMLNADGGHPGNQNHAAVRRWTAPRDGTVQISGKLGHSADAGDGVRGRIVSSRAGKLGEWVAKNTKVDTATDQFDVKRGEQIDFIVDCRVDENSDSFTWAPRLRYTGELPKEMAEARKEWEARTDFGGTGDSATKALTPWEKYAQVLLLSNEVSFVD